MAVGMGGPRNAGLLAVQILALSDDSLREKLDQFKLKLVDGTPDRILRQLRSALGWTGDTSSFGIADGHIIVTNQYLPSPIVTPLRMVAPAPTQTLFPITTAATSASPMGS